MTTARAHRTPQQVREGSGTWEPRGRGGRFVRRTPEGPHRQVRCAYRELDPSVATMRAADHGLRDDPAKRLDWSANRRVLGQRQVRASLVVVAGIPGQNPTKVCFAK